MPIPENIEIVLPWEAVEEKGNRSEILFKQLKKELSPAHPLYGMKVRAVAARVDCDDVLFEVDGAAVSLAVVHLTWAQKRLESRYPRVKFFQSWGEWLCNEMQPNHEEYLLGS